MIEATEDSQIAHGSIEEIERFLAVVADFASTASDHLETFAEVKRLPQSRHLCN